MAELWAKHRGEWGRLQQSSTVTIQIHNEELFVIVKCLAGRAQVIFLFTFSQAARVLMGGFSQYIVKFWMSLTQ